MTRSGTRSVGCSTAVRGSSLREFGHGSSTCCVVSKRRPHRSATCTEGHHGLVLSGVAEESDHFQKTFEQMMREFATKHPDVFVDFVIENEGADLNLVHRLLSLGLEQIAAHRPKVVLRYLTADPRRLGIAEVWYDFDSTRSAALLAAVVPGLGTDDAHRLEEAIVGWQYYLDEPTDPDLKHRSGPKKTVKRAQITASPCVSA